MLSTMGPVMIAKQAPDCKQIENMYAGHFLLTRLQ